MQIIAKERPNRNLTAVHLADHQSCSRVSGTATQQGCPSIVVIESAEGHRCGRGMGRPRGSACNDGGRHGREYGWDSMHANKAMCMGERPMWATKGGAHLGPQPISKRSMEFGH